MHEICENCKHWDDSGFLTDGESVGSCVRFPPMLIHLMARTWEESQQNDAWAYPQTSESERCGEFTMRISRVAV